MIRFPIKLGELKKLIRAAQPTWFDDAAAALDSLPATPKSSDFRPIWSKIKKVYIELQHSKCCFCEKPLEGTIEQDVEHFRPKTEVKPWRLPDRLAGVMLSQPSATDSEPGYTRLAYHPFNLAMACKVCNTILKCNYFPIAGRRRSTAQDPSAMKRERAYLIYPIGEQDDPEDLIEFAGFAPRPKHPVGFPHLRALVVIELFKLDDRAERPMLFKGRALLLLLLFDELRGLARENEPLQRQKHQTTVEVLTKESAPFASCLRSFRRLYDTDPNRAERYADACREFLAGTSFGDILD